jgi:hypothetical protein
VLELRQCPDAPVVAALDRQLPHVRQHDEPHVLRNVAAHGAEQVHVDRRRQPGELEALQPPQSEPVGDHRVQAAQGAVLHRPTIVA